MNNGRAYFGFVNIDWFIYVIGGLNKDSNYINFFESYDLKNNKWTNLASLPVSGRGVGMCPINGTYI